MYLSYTEPDFWEMRRAAIFTVPLWVLDRQCLLVLWQQVKIAVYSPQQPEEIQPHGEQRDHK